MVFVPRAATTTDVFNAIAEPARRRILETLGDGDAHSVGHVVQVLRLPQPAVSKHLKVLLDVGVVSVTRQGSHRLYRLEPEQLKPLHDWVNAFKRLWTHQLDTIKHRAGQKMFERFAGAGKRLEEK